MYGMVVHMHGWGPRKDMKRIRFSTARWSLCEAFPSKKGHLCPSCAGGHPSLLFARRSYRTIYLSVYGYNFIRYFEEVR